VRPDIPALVFSFIFVHPLTYVWVGVKVLMIGTFWGLAIILRNSFVYVDTYSGGEKYPFIISPLEGPKPVSPTIERSGSTKNSLSGIWCTQTFASASNASSIYLCVDVNTSCPRSLVYCTLDMGFLANSFLFINFILLAEFLIFSVCPSILSLVAFFHSSLFLSCS
jgi:hypothetical protein